MNLKVGQSLSIDGGRVMLHLEHKSGQRVTLRFVTDEDIRIMRPQDPFKSGAEQARLGVKVPV